MNISVEALKAPTQSTLDKWLNTPRLAHCGKYFTPSESSWRPDPTEASINCQMAIAHAHPGWQRWLQAALAYRMSEHQQSSIYALASVLSRAGQIELDPLNENHLIDLRERFNVGEFAQLASFIAFWGACESLDQRPDQALVDAYEALPRKKKATVDVILTLDPVKGPMTQVEQDALYQWASEKFSLGKLDPEHYLYLRLLMLYGLRSVQMRKMVFDDFIQCEDCYQIRVFWAKQKTADKAGWRTAFETFSLDKDLFDLIQGYKTIVLTRLKQEYPLGANWDKAINNVPLFRRKLIGGNNLADDAPLPVMLQSDNHAALENTPQAEFHVGTTSVNCWFERMQKQDGFPISPRTHQKLKIMNAHRFKHTLGTDLSNAGLGEHAMARALMHSDTRTVRKYRQVSAELMKLIDAKMSDHLAVVVSAFTGRVVADRASAVNGEREDRQIEDLAVCGASAVCHLDAPFTCYVCSKFQPFVDADHHTALERLERRREQTRAVDPTTGVLWDRAILACRKIILDCEALRAVSTPDRVKHD